jgi:hypothetical protein
MNGMDVCYKFKLNNLRASEKLVSLADVQPISKRLVLLGNTMNPCKVKDCDNKYHAKGYCIKHYARFRRYGDPLYITKRRDQEKHGMENTTEYKTWGGSNA